MRGAVNCSQLQDHLDMQPKLVQFCSSCPVKEIKGFKIQSKDPSFSRHSELVPISVLGDIATINNRTYYNMASQQPTANKVVNMIKISQYQSILWSSK
jgi:hypothetical protein